MNSNYPKINNTRVEAGKFAYVRMPVTVEAYGETFTLPVKTVEFCDKLDAITAESLKTTNTSDGVRVIKKGIALFIGEDKAEELFPADKLMEQDFDEIFGFWSFLKHENNRQQRELLAQYR